MQAVYSLYAFPISPMKTLKILSIASVLAVAGCNAAPSSGTVGMPLLERLRNPLIAERYWSEMAEHMADYSRRNDPVLKDGVKASIIESERTRALERLETARTLQREGVMGQFITPSQHEDARGFALLVRDRLYFDSTFITFPSPGMRVYLTEAVDPRDVNFPDTSALDLGPLQSAYGDQTYGIPEEHVETAFRTVVLYDRELNLIIGMAQLAK